MALVGVALIWPLGAWAVLASRRPPVETRWRPFAWSAAAAVLVALVLIASAELIARGDGTTEAMTALGAGVLAAACLAGGVVCGLVALVLRALSRRDGPPG